jgi:capsular polysaccharide biosynthesis protein
VTEKDYPGGRIPPSNTVVRSLNGGSGLPGRLVRYDSFAAADDQPADLATGLVSLAFIRAAIRRRARFWCVLALIGLLAGAGLYLSSPAAYKATTSLLLTPGPYESINTAANNDQAMAQSRTVAGLAVQRLGLSESPASFLATYTATPVTERVLIITVSAPSSSQAMQRASAIAAAFLQFRAREMQSEQQLVLASLNQQISQAEKHYSSLNAQINQLSAQSQSDAQQSELKSLRSQRTSADTTLYNLQQAAIQNQTVTRPATAAAVNGSVVLDAAIPLAHSRFKPLILDVAIGLIVGVVLGIAIVVIGALVSDRLRRRDDIARALGAPVKLSVGPVPPKGWLPNLPRRGGRSLMSKPDVLRITTHLGRAVPANAKGVASLAVVPVDDLRVPALSLVALAESRAGGGERVVVADLCRGAPAAKLLGAGAPGIRTVTGFDARLVAAVPESNELAPAGPLPAGGGQHIQRSPFALEVAAACESADLLLTLIPLDPSLGGEHLTMWAQDVVVTVTAGRSSWTKIRGVSEMIRLSGARLVSAVLIGVDKTDESLGVVYTPETV